MRVAHGTFQGIISLLVVVGTFGLAGASLYLNGTAIVPDWTIALVSTIAAFYFGQRATTVGLKNGWDMHRQETHGGHPHSRADDH